MASSDLDHQTISIPCIPMQQTIAEQAQRQLLPRFGLEDADSYRLAGAVATR